MSCFKRSSPILPEDTKFEVRQHIACYSQDGQLRRHKPPGKKRWARYDKDDDFPGGAESLEDLSVVKKSGVALEDGCEADRLREEGSE